MPRSSSSASTSLDSSPEQKKISAVTKAHSVQQDQTDSPPHNSVKLEEPFQPEHIEAEPLHTAPLESTLTLVPVRNLFKKAEIDAIVADNNLARNLL